MNVETGKCEITDQLFFSKAKNRRPEIIPSKRQRIITLPTPCLRLLQNIGYSYESQLIFPSCQGQPISYYEIYKNLQVIQQHSGVKRFTHKTMIQNFIVQCLKAGVDIVSLENYCGYRRGYIPRMPTTHRLPHHIPCFFTFHK